MSRDDLVDDSGAPNAFENDGYDEPGPESDEALTHALPAAGTTASWETAGTTRRTGTGTRGASLRATSRPEATRGDLSLFSRRL